MVNMRLDMAIPLNVLTQIAGLAANNMQNWRNNLFNFTMNWMTNKNNRQMMDDTNAQNRQMFNEQMAWTKELQQKLFEREDTSYQRTVADLQKAGLSPLAMNGTNDAGTTVAAPSPNPMLSGRDQAFEGTSNPLQFGELADQILQNERLAREDKKLNIEATKVKNDYELRRREDETRRSIAADENETRIKTVTDQIRFQTEQSNRSLSQAQQQHLDSLDLQNRQLSELQRSTSEKERQAIQQYYLDTVRQATNGRSANYKVYDDKAKYKIALENYHKRLSDFIEVNKDLLSKSSGSTSGSVSAGLGANLGAIPGSNLGANSSQSRSSSFSSSKDDTKMFDEKLQAWYASNPFPVLAPNAH